MLDPEEGFIVTANQAVVDEDYPYLLTDDWDHGYRSPRIREVLEDEGELSVEEMVRPPARPTNPMAETLVPYLLDIRTCPTATTATASGCCATGTARSRPTARAAAYFNVVWRNLLELTFHDELPVRTWPDGGDRWFAVVEPDARPSPPGRGGTTPAPTTRSRRATTSCGRRCSTPATS